MSQVTEKNKRIAQNTLYMYLRMLITMLVSLYTSRVVLQTLGVEDFGIYNIVGGVVVLFTFVNSAMTTGTQRHLSYELGKPDKGNITQVFSACMHIHCWLALIILILAETIGLWFLNTEMNFPIERMAVVNWVYQLSILGCIVNIIKVPYQASIIAYERMSFYAYTGIIEAVLKLVIVYILLIFAIDKLLLYSILTLIVTLIMAVAFILFCHREFKQISLVRVQHKSLYKRLVSFSGWAMFGSVANLGLQQGINVIINIFYGVTINAAVGIANQVNSAVMQFVSGFQQALNPQLIKSEAEGDRKRQFQLICESSKLSFFIMFVVAFPLLLNLEYILTLWLGEYPPHAETICSTIIIGALIECLSGPLWVSIFATGKIKTYQIAISSILILNVPISYIGGKFGMSPEGMYIIRNIIYVFALATRLFFLKQMISLKIMAFLYQVVFPIFKVLCLVSLPVLLYSQRIITYANDFISLLWQSIALGFYGVISIYIAGLQTNERDYIITIIQNRLKK